MGGGSRLKEQIDPGTELTRRLSEFGFDPSLFAGPEWRIRDFHARQVSFFHGAKRVLDLGCGRGLFLEALKQAGIDGVGVDMSANAVECCRGKRLAAHHADVLGFLESEEGRRVAGTCDAVYCAHVVEHLDPIDVLRLFRAVKTHGAPGVRFRVITNNPEDVTVLGHVFWADLTHRRLYPGCLLEAMAASQGFASVESQTFLGLKLGKRERVMRWLEKPFWGRYKWLPNLRVDCR